MSRALDAVRSALARWAVSEQIDQDPSLLDRYGRGAREAWRSDTEIRLSTLSDAMAIGRPDLLAEQIAWSKVAFASRENPVEDLRRNLEAIRQVVGEELPEQAARTAEAYLDEAMDRLAQAPESVEPVLTPDLPHAELASAYLERLLEGDRAPAIRLVLEAVERGDLTVFEAYEHVLERVQQEMGRLWQLNQLGIADEHLATTATQTLMSRLHAMAEPAEPTGLRILITSVAGDLHQVGAQMLSDYFDMGGWQALFLGANTPASALIETLMRGRADALALSCSFGGNVRSTAEVIAAVRTVESLADRPILVGGTPFRRLPDLWRDVGADGSAGTAAEAVRLAKRLVAPEPAV